MIFTNSQCPSPYKYVVVFMDGDLPPLGHRYACLVNMMWSKYAVNRQTFSTRLLDLYINSLGDQMVIATKYLN
jgi:hypothetical protein